MADFNWILKIIGCRLPELSIYKGRLKSKKAAYTTCFPCITLNSNSHSVLSPRGRELERGQQAARLVFGRLGYWGRLPQLGECPLSNPPPRGEGADCSGFRRCRSSEKECPKHQRQEFFRCLYRKADGTNAASVFSDDL